MTIELDYSHIQRTLAASHALADAAEAHGTLAGALCALVPVPDGGLAGRDPAEGVTDMSADPALQTLYDATVASLAGRQMEFDLLIPAERRADRETHPGTDCLVQRLSIRSGQ